MSHAPGNQGPGLRRLWVHIAQIDATGTVRKQDKNDFKFTCHDFVLALSATHRAKNALLAKSGPKFLPRSTDQPPAHFESCFTPSPSHCHMGSIKAIDAVMLSGLRESSQIQVLCVVTILSWKLLPAAQCPKLCTIFDVVRILVNEFDMTSFCVARLSESILISNKGPSGTTQQHETI